MSDAYSSSVSGFPNIRLRRLRYHPLVRELAREVRLTPSNFVLPLFVRAGSNIKQEIGSMPGQFQWSPDRLGEEIQAIKDLGLGGVLLFGIPEKKDWAGSDSYSDSGIIQQGIRAVKETAPNLLVMTDVCFCE
ncbi:MAG TPA: porphobilinogen synthase, partial [Pirellulales bacterium]